MARVKLLKNTETPFIYSMTSSLGSAAEDCTEAFTEPPCTEPPCFCSLMLWAQVLTVSTSMLLSFQSAGTPGKKQTFNHLMLQATKTTPQHTRQKSNDF